MHKPRVVLVVVALMSTLVLVISLVGCKSSGTTATPTPTVTTTGAVTTATPTPVPTATPTPKPLQGTLTGTWSGQGPTGSVNGTFSATIYGNGTVEGAIGGSYAGALTGQVDASGNFNATGSAGINTNGLEATWTGKVTQSGKSLSIQGTWSGSNRSGTFSGTGVVSP